MNLEPGYTPRNLRAVILALGLPLDMPSHRDMPYAAWLRLISLLPTT